VSGPPKASSPSVVKQLALSLANHMIENFSLEGLREEEYCTTRTDYQYKVTQ
jgi:hypothetical protein